MDVQEDRQSANNRLYNDLSWIWPLWEDVSDYRDETEKIANLFRKHSPTPPKTLLDVGCGGGKTSYWLKRHFSVTGVDLSPAMLKEARRLNPDCEFIQGDMRGFRVGRRFDCVFLNDSIAYMASRDDLLKTFRNAHAHLRDGGVMICIPERTKETFVQNESLVDQARSSLKPKGADIAILENYYDPDPSDDQIDMTFVFLIRQEGALQIETDRHTLGLFSKKTWIESLESAGFGIAEENVEMGGKVYPVFVCIK